MGETNDSCVPLGPESRVLRAKGIDDPPQAQVDAGGHEGRADGETADLHEEAVLVPLIVPTPDAAAVADDLAEQTEEHGDGEGKAAAGDGVRDQVSDQGETEQG